MIVCVLLFRLKEALRKLNGRIMPSPLADVSITSMMSELTGFVIRECIQVARAVNPNRQPVVTPEIVHYVLGKHLGLRMLRTEEGGGGKRPLSEVSIMRKHNAFQRPSSSVVAKEEEEEEKEEEEKEEEEEEEEEEQQQEGQPPRKRRRG